MPLLRQTLREEIEAHKKLSQLADRISLKAANSKESDGDSSSSRKAGMTQVARA